MAAIRKKYWTDVLASNRKLAEATTSKSMRFSGGIVGRHVKKLAPLTKSLGYFKEACTRNSQKGGRNGV
jgi:hypothetical protein